MYSLNKDIPIKGNPKRKQTYNIIITLRVCVCKVKAVYL